MNTASVFTTDGLISYFGPGDADLQRPSLRLTLRPRGVCQSCLPAFMLLHDPEFRAAGASKLGPSHGLEKVRQLFLPMFPDRRRARLLMYLPFPPTRNGHQKICRRRPRRKRCHRRCAYVQVCCRAPLYHVEIKTTNDKVWTSHTPTPTLARLGNPRRSF
jgi:hypothetical protein